MNKEQRHHLESLVAAGEIAKASAFLKEFIYSQPLNLGSTEFLSELCMLYIKQSRYAEAYEQGKVIQELVKIKDLPFWRVLLAAHVLATFSLFEKSFLRKIGKRLSGYLISYQGIAKIDYKTFDGILWGVYWQNMRQALKMNVLCALTAQDENQKIRSLAFLYYTLAFYGYSWVGLSGLRKLVRYCEFNGKNEILGDMLTWVGVAYQMGRYPDECLAIHKKLAEKFPKAEPFHQIISYASQLNMAAAELGPKEVSAALHKCFSISFALKESRNHIQIFGAKAELLALEGRREEAISFLERAEQAKVRNANTLDNAIFNRFAAVTFLNLGEPVKALEHIAYVQEAIKMYAPLMWYKQEIARLTAIAQFQLNPTGINKLVQISIFIAKTIYFPNLHLIGKTFAFANKFLVQKGMTYWNPQDIAEYFKQEMFKMNKESRATTLEKVTVLLTKAILDSKNIYSNESAGVGSLLKQISSVFPGSKVVHGENLNECLNEVRKEYGVSSSFLINEEGDSLKVACAENKYLVAIQLNKIDLGDTSFAVGVISEDLDLNSQEVVESALRIISTLHYSIRLSLRLQQERVVNENRLAIAGIARQVAHDIRSPLGALELALRGVELPSENRNLLLNASDRIKSIADDLLNRSRAFNQSKPAAVPKLQFISESFFVEEIINSIVSEKKLLTGLDITSEIKGELIAMGNKILFQRILSNLMNNAEEAQSEFRKLSIHLTAVARKDKIIISIQDNGKGIPENILSKIGETGFSYGKINGNGLGVSFAKETIESWNGEFYLSSKEEVGTLIQIVLPTALEKEGTVMATP